jgi:hypothetical protein
MLFHEVSHSVFPQAPGNVNSGLPGPADQQLLPTVWHDNHSHASARANQQDRSQENDNQTHQTTVIPEAVIEKQLESQRFIGVPA